MKTLSLTLIAILTLFSTASAAPIGLTVTATITGGTSLAQHTLIACNGYNYDVNGDPWTQAACYNKTAGATTMTFGGKNGTPPLVKDLLDSSGNPTVGADCFYAANFYIVYLFPDAWGGRGYELKQSAAVGDVDIQKALVFTPVYSEQDRFCYGTPQTCTAQGILNPSEEGWNPQLTPSISSLAATPQYAGLILKSNRARIVRAEYGIPPKPGTGQTRPSGWVAIPLTKTATTYSANVTITLTELPSL